MNVPVLVLEQLKVPLQVNVHGHPHRHERLLDNEDGHIHGSYCLKQMPDQLS